MVVYSRVDRRRKAPLRDNIHGVTKPAIRRLARRGGVKRLPEFIYDEIRSELENFLEEVIRESVIYTEHNKRNTVTDDDVVHVLSRKGRKLYGYGNPSREWRRITKKCAFSEDDSYNFDS